jgi:hypothetical protein
VVTAAMSIQYFVIELPLPLWIVEHTAAPRWSVPLFLLINLFLVMLFQLRVGRNVRTIRQGGTAILGAGAIFLVSCTAIGLAAGLAGWAAALLLVGAVALHTYGELWFSRASLVFDLRMPPEHAQGSYQGLSAISLGAGSAVAPVILIGLVLGSGRAGWVWLGAGLLMLGLSAPALAWWAERTRSR